MMASDSDIDSNISDGNDGPPAKNLRKKSGSTNVGENNMAFLSDKTSRVKKSQKQKGRTSSQETPSVAGWLRMENQLNGSCSENTSEAESERGKETDRMAESNIDKSSEWVDQYGDGPRESWSEAGSEGDWNTGHEKEREAEDWEEEQLNPNVRNDGRENTEDEEQTRQQAKHKGDIDFDKLSLEEMRTIVKSMYTKISRLESQLKKGQKTDASNERLQRKMEVVEERIDTAIKAVVSQDQLISNNKKKVTQIEAKIMKNNIVVSGITEQKGEKCKEVISEFFKEKMKIQKSIEVIEAFRVGQKDEDRVRSMIVKLANLSDKALIYKNVKHLRELKQKKNEEYYVKDQLPDILEEEVRKKKQKVKINKNLIDAQQQCLEWKRGELHVDGAQFKPKVSEPTNAEILMMEGKDIKKILSMKMHPGETMSKNGSFFTGYAVKVHTIQQVVDSYRQLKYRFLDAAHVMCAYRIMDPDVAHIMDCTDGGELGAGRHLLDLLIQESCENVAVFVVRQHRDPNIGPIRFAMIEDAAKSTVQVMPIGIDQLFAAHSFSLHQKPRDTKSSGERFHERSGTTAGRGRHHLQRRPGIQQQRKPGVDPAETIRRTPKRDEKKADAQKQLFQYSGKAPITSVEV